MIKVATLFSGIGTPENSLKHLNIEHETVFACEIDKYARQTYLINNQEPNTFYKDVTKLDANKYLNQIDILIGGFPCQAFSIAGKQLGFEDTRGTYFFDCARIVKESQPKVFIFENVKGLISHDKPKKPIEINGITYKKGYPSHFNKEYNGHKKGIGKTLYTIETVLLELGYSSIYWDVANTKDYGIPQNRERIYIVGFKEKTNFEFAPKQELKLKLKDMLEDEVDSKYLLNQKLVTKYLETGTASNHQSSQAGKVVDTNMQDTFHTVNAGSHGYSMGYIKLQQTHKLNIKGNDSIKRIYSENGLCPALTTMGGGNREPKVAIKNNTLSDNTNFNEWIKDTQGYGETKEEFDSLVMHDKKITIANGLIEVENNEVRVKEAVKQGYSVANKGDSINISVPSSKTRRGRVGRQVAQTLDTACNQVVFSKVDEKYHLSKERLKTCLESNHSAQRVYCHSGIAPTISAGSNGGGKEPVKMVYSNKLPKSKDEIVRIKSIPNEKYIFRKLTPRECFRLQGFDDSFVFPEKMSNTQLYKQAGNAMSRNILDMIFTQIFKTNFLKEKNV